MTISKATYVAKPGDIITVHEGIYREWVNPKSGGTSSQPIIYQAAEGVYIENNVFFNHALAYKKEKGVKLY